MGAGTSRFPALAIGILLEKNAHAFYQASAKREEDEVIRGFFRELAERENGHYHLLLHEDEALRDAYWSENRFSPLLRRASRHLINQRNACFAPDNRRYSGLTGSRNVFAFPCGVFRFSVSA